MEYAKENDRESDLLAMLFSKGQFCDKLKGHTPEIIDFAYEQIVNDIATILLLFGVFGSLTISFFIHNSIAFVDGYGKTSHLPQIRF